MYWRLTLDNPIQQATERGIQIPKHKGDFRPEKDSFSATYREPTTGLVILEPSIFSADWANELQPLSSFRVTAEPGYWQALRRSIDEAQMFSTTKPAEGGFSLIEILVEVAIVAILAAALDDLKWAMESNFALEVDESWALHYTAITDEVQKKNNWFAVQWDNILLHFSARGIVRAYQYDRENLSTAPVLVEEFEIAVPTELLHGSGYFWFLPIPGFGLLIQHKNTPQASGIFSSSAQQASVRSHVIPWPHHTVGGVNRLFESSPIRIALNPYHAHVLGVQRVTFASAGFYMDGIINPDYRPNSAPSVVAPIFLETMAQGISATLYNATGTGVWTAPTDRQARMLCALTTIDTKYTPFLFGYAVKWEPVFETRATTPLVLGRFASDGLDYGMKLEFTEDEKGTFEGTAEIRLGSAQGMAIAERGDATFLLENSEDGFTWNEYNGGFAQNWEVEPVFAGTQFFYRCNISLHDMRLRFKENQHFPPAALDGLSIAEANNVLLTVNGQAAIPIADYPPIAVSTLIPRPPDGESWRYEPREGDDCDDMVDVLLFLLRAPNIEYRERFDWNLFSWVMEAKPHNESPEATWTLTPFASDADADNRVWYCAPGWRLLPERPEANVVQAEGMTKPGKDGMRVPAEPVTNVDSIGNPASVDYLGRAITFKVTLPFRSESSDVDIDARRILDAISHRRLKANDVPIPRLQMALLPCTHIQMTTPTGAIFFDGWIKRRSIKVDQEGRETMGLTLDSEWIGELSK